MHGAWPVSIAALGGSSVATVAWRQGPQQFVTAIVKGTFAFVPDGAMAAITPDPIYSEEQPSASGVGLAAADDLAPYLGQTDVCITGHAPAPRTPGTRAVRVR